MRGIKVKGHANLVRSGSIPGLILSNNTEAAQAALRGRQRQETQDQIIEEQAVQLAQLQNQMAAMLAHVGVPDSLQPEQTEEETNVDSE